MMCSRRGKGDPGSFLRCRQILLGSLCGGGRPGAQEGAKEGQVQSNQLHACNLIRETARRHDDQSCAWEVRHEEVEYYVEHERRE
jgi:hypothetical protein